MELKRFTARSNSLENSMSRMSWHTSASETPASPAARRARPSSVSLKSTPVVSQSRRANSTEWRPKPQGASSTRAPVSSPVAPAIHWTSLAASVPDSTDCEICGHASRKNRSLWNTRGIIFPFVTTLVTGAFGCIGAWVVRGLLASGERPVVFDLGDDPWRVRMIVGPDVAGRITIERGDITDRERVARVVRDHAIRQIIHLAAWQVPLCRQDPSRGGADQRRRYRERLRGRARRRRSDRADRLRLVGGRLRPPEPLPAGADQGRRAPAPGDALRRLQGRQRGDGAHLLGGAQDPVDGVPPPVGVWSGAGLRADR